MKENKLYGMNLRKAVVARQEERPQVTRVVI